MERGKLHTYIILQLFTKIGNRSELKIFNLKQFKKRVIAIHTIFFSFTIMYSLYI